MLQRRLHLPEPAAAKEEEENTLHNTSSSIDNFED